MIGSAGSIETKTSSEPFIENLFVDVTDTPLFQQQPTISQESIESESANYRELLSNYSDNVGILTIPDLTRSKSLTNRVNKHNRFPAYKWECTLPENIVDQQSTQSINDPVFRKSPTYSLWTSSNSSSPSARRVSLQQASSLLSRTEDDMLAENASDIDCGLDSDECLEMVSIFDELIRDKHFTSASNYAHIDYAAIDGTTTRLFTGDPTSANNPTPLFRRTKTYSIHSLARLREKAVVALERIFKESIDKENCPEWPRHEHTLTKRLGNSFRKARRLSSYGYKKEIFGRSLTSIRAQSSSSSPFPLFIHHILTILLHEARSSNNVEGLMRTAASKSKLDSDYKLCNALGVNDPLPEKLCSAYNIYILADLLKRFLREIPESLLPHHVWHLILRCFKLDGQKRLLSLQYCVLLLNSAQREALFIISAFLLELSFYESNTLMNIRNLATVIVPNIAEMGTADPLKQSNNCKVLVGPLTFLIEHIYDIMCVPTDLLVYSDISSLNNSPKFQVALNNLVFNLNYSLLEKVPSYWRYERVAAKDIVAKSSVNYDDLQTESTEFRVEMELQASANAIFALLVDSDRRWNPLFLSYKKESQCDAESGIIKCKTRFCQADDPPLHLKRYNGRIYEPKSQAQIYVLLEKSLHYDASIVNIHRLLFLIFPTDAYRTKVIFLSSIESPGTEKHSPELATLVLERFREQCQFESDSPDLDKR